MKNPSKTWQGSGRWIPTSVLFQHLLGLVALSINVWWVFMFGSVWGCWIFLHSWWNPWLRVAQHPTRHSSASWRKLSWNGSRFLALEPLELCTRWESSPHSSESPLWTLEQSSSALQQSSLSCGWAPEPWERKDSGIVCEEHILRIKWWRANIISWWAKTYQPQSFLCSRGLHSLDCPAGKVQHQGLPFCSYIRAGHFWKAGGTLSFISQVSHGSCNSNNTQ